MIIDWDSQVGSAVVDFQDFGAWQVGTETRTYAYPSSDRQVTVCLEGRAPRELIEALDRGDESVMPMHFYTVWTHEPDGSERYNVTAGLVPEEVVRRAHVMEANLWEWIAAEVKPVLGG